MSGVRSWASLSMLAVCRGEDKVNPKPIAALLAAAAAMLASGCRDEIPPQDPVRPVRTVTPD